MDAPDLSIASTRSVEKRVATNTGLMVISKGLGALFGLLSLLIATKSLGATAMGVILFLHSYHLLFAQLATFQAWQTVIRFGMDDIHRQDATGLVKLFKFGYKLDLISGVVAFIGAVAFFPVFILLQDSFPTVFDKLGDEFDMRSLYLSLIHI